MIFLRPSSRNWNLKGREELMPIEDLVKMVTDCQLMWTFEDTCNAVWERKRKKFFKEGQEDDVKRPDKKTVNGYHTALLSIPELANRVVKPEFVHMKPGPKPKNNNIVDNFRSADDSAASKALDYSLPKDLMLV